MSKQIQIGYDKVPAPITKDFPQLVDIEGIPLTDSAGNPLVTEEDAVLGSFAKADGALSTIVNNVGKKQSVPVVEQFPSESVVSNSLLGIPRAEEQLSLFSDVSTYGLDEQNWTSYEFIGIRNYPKGWYSKENPIHGDRRFPKLYEGTEEQALYLESFPSQYSFPYGPIAERVKENVADALPYFPDYLNFIAVGKYLYNLFSVNANTETFAKLNFLNENIKIIDSNLVEVSGYEFDEDNLIFSGNGSFYEVEYGETDNDLIDSFNQIERWTKFFQQIKDEAAQFPSLSSGQLEYVESDEYAKLRQFCIEKCTPGNSSTYESFAILESKNTYRYQPGRVSGFTFGIRLQADPSSSANFIEWGCSNKTDEYMFQLVGTRLNIVRRSVVPFPSETLIDRFGLSPEDQKLKFTVGLTNEFPLHETVFERRSWNGDRLDGNGPSGYILSLEDVTMFKIEFSWYGAIGAKFYAYVPSGNGEARWVLMHTLVIENGLTGPIMQNPDLKFKYLLYSVDTEKIDAPLYVYKYGSSYYIDGGDEGTIRLSTVVTDSKAYGDRTPMLGLLPKNDIFNQDGIGIENYKKIYPDVISIRASEDTRIDIEEIQGDSSGQQYIYQPSLRNGRHPFSRTFDVTFQSENEIQITVPAAIETSGFTITESPLSISNSSNINLFEGWQAGDEIIVTNLTDNESGRYLILDVSENPINTLSVRYIGNDSPITVSDEKEVRIVHAGIASSEDEAKLIADGIYNMYIDYTPDEISAAGQLITSPLLRRVDWSLTSNVGFDRMLKSSGELVLPGQTVSDVRIAPYNTIAASTVPILANEFYVHFMIPNPRDAETSDNHYAEFAITFTSDEPSSDVVGEEQRLLFGGETRTVEELKKYPYIEFSHQEARPNIAAKAEDAEWDPSYGERLMVDPRLPYVSNDDNGGYHARIKGSVLINNYPIASSEEIDAINYYLFFASGNAPNATFFDSNPDSLTSEVGVNLVGSGWYFVGVPDTVVDPETGAISARIQIRNVDETTSISTILNAGAIQTKILRIEDQWELVSYPSNEVIDEDTVLINRFDDQKFVVERALKFNIQPLYPVFLMRDYAEINNISIEEVTPETRYTKSPSFIVDPGIVETRALLYDRFSGSSETRAPANFISDERLSGLRYDTQSSNPLRPGTVINSFYVEKDKPTTISLANVFNYDRRSLAKGLLNNKAIYFTATRLSGTSGNIEATLIAKEQ